MQPNDCITFFWRESDDDTAPYVYQSFKGISPEQETSTVKSPIIKPTFVLDGVPRDEAKINPSKLLEKGTIPYGDATYYIVNKFYGENDLSGSKEIQIRGLNQLELKPSKHQFYFITNSIKDGKYELKMKRRKYDEERRVVQYRYSLGTDEYFIYTDGKKESFEILGSGTLIAIDEVVKVDENGSLITPPLLKTLSVDTVSIQDISSKGISAITDWLTPSWAVMFVREQQIHNLVSGDTLQIGINEDVKSDDAEFNILYDSGVMTEWKYNTAGVNRPYFTSNADTFVRGFSVSYVNSGGTTVKLPTISITSDDSQWSGRACLNIDCSSGDPQQITPVSKSLQSMQSVTIEGVTTPAQTTNELKKYVVTNTDDSVQPDNYYIESDVLINKVGGDNVDVSYVTLDGNRKDVNFYLYKKVKEFNTKPFNVRDDGDVELYWNWSNIEWLKDSNTVSVDISVDPSNYILTVFNQSEVQSFKLTTNNGVVITDLSAPDGCKGRYYYKLDASESSSFTLTFTKVDASATPSDNDVLIIGSLFKFAPNNDFEEPYGISHTDLMNAIDALDIENRFKYNYIVDDSIKIDDPLEAKKFFDNEHVFNGNTLAKAELLLDTTGSYIHINNNR